MAKIKKDQFHVAVDAAVFTILNNELKLLLIKRKREPSVGKFALPGGFVELDENLDAAAKRELEEETGVKNIFLKQLKTFGDVNRDPRGRVIAIAYLALIDAENIKLHSTGDAELAKWFSIYELPQLAFDHKKIVKCALDYLKENLEESNLAFQFMPKLFTLTELQKAYEFILDSELDKRNFRKKLNELKVLKETNKTKMEGAHRPAKLYSFK